MIIVRHHAACKSKPDIAGRLTGTCNCKTAPLDEAARTQLQTLLKKLSDDSLHANEDPEYLALRLHVLAEQIEKGAHRVRCAIKRADSAAKRAKSPGRLSTCPTTKDRRA